ncbi:MULTISPECIES: ATP-binding protein [Rhizobium]|uniref:ATP-binding protein n=1 Tax=Rhizobium TaxID=379 RepID=UPI002ED85AF0
MKSLTGYSNHSLRRKGTEWAWGSPICRSIVESHEGRIWAEKNEPQGAVFIFTLPIESDASHEPTA